jgi:hypothetical protein
MTKQEKMNEIVEQINNAVSILGNIDNIKFRTDKEVIELKSTASLVGLINNRFEDFKSVTLGNNEHSVLISKM